MKFTDSLLSQGFIGFHYCRVLISSLAWMSTEPNLSKSVWREREGRWARAGWDFPFFVTKQWKARRNCWIHAPCASLKCDTLTCYTLISRSSKHLDFRFCEYFMLSNFFRVSVSSHNYQVLARALAQVDDSCLRFGRVEGEVCAEAIKCPRKNHSKNLLIMGNILVLISNDALVERQ